MNSKKHLENQVALITGGGRGIGAAAACLLAEQGASVVIASRTLQELQEVAFKAPEQIVPFQVDVADEVAVERLFAFIMSRWGKLDILVNAAAIIKVQPFDQMSLTDWQKILDVNVLGSVICSRQAFLMMKKNGGSIVNISSLGGIQNTEKFEGFSAYTVSKFAMTGLTEALAVEGRPYNIRINALALGAVDTRMLKEAAPHLKTNVQPEEIARLIYFLADKKQSGQMSGSIIPVFSNEKV